MDEEWVLISSYSRNEAIADGVLIDIAALVTCRETSDHSILEVFPTVQVFPILPTEMFWRHVVQA